MVMPVLDWMRQVRDAEHPQSGKIVQGEHEPVSVPASSVASASFESSMRGVSNDASVAFASLGASIDGPASTRGRSKMAASPIARR